MTTIQIFIPLKPHEKESHIRRVADKSLAFPICYFLICSTTKRNFLKWVKEVRTTKSYVCGAQGGIYCIYIFFFNSVVVRFINPKTCQPHRNRIVINYEPRRTSNDSIIHFGRQLTTYSTYDRPHLRPQKK
jgi:hypothetical protein